MTSTVVGVLSVDVHSVDVHSVDVHSVDVHSVDVHSVDVHRVDVHSVDVHSVDVHSEGALGPAPTMTSSSSRPPRFVQCYVCHKQFGSHSIDIHEPKCLGKWRAFNATLPRNRREATPSPPPGHPHHQEHHLRPEMSPTPAAYTPTSDPDDLSSSWHDPQHQRLRRPRSASYGDLSAKNRPATATLKKPKVLDLSLRNAVDMSQMTRSMVDQLILSRDSQSGFSDYSSDFTSSSPSSVGSKSPFDDSGDSENESRRARPSTMRLPRPSRNIAVPVITSASRPTKRTSSLRSFIPRNRRRQVEEVFTGPKNKVKIPEPCLTCGKEQNPERFHSHPLHMQKFKPKSEDKNKSKQLNKLIVTKPTALKYKSKSFDDEKKSSGRKSKLKPPNAINLKSRSVETSPVLTKKADAAEKTVPLKKFIQNQKASIAKGQKDFNIEIYGRDVSPSQQSENGISPLSQRKREVTVKQNKLNSEKSVSQQRASHPPRHIGKIEEESEGSCEPGSNSGSRGADSSQPGSNSGSRGADSSQPGSNSGSRGADSSQPGSNSGSRGADSSQPGSNSGSRGADSSHPSSNSGSRGADSSQPGSNSGSRGADSSQPSSNRGSTAPTMVCYICGRGFGSKSLSIHEPQCLEVS
ncbi:dentin sialophosphoprotein [Procambarus clarkii]|uniref:dentin sialophosphoprotein n=1 Tax=Procambarus clarkii TaxID=6728 RepID=UPI003742083D